MELTEEWQQFNGNYQKNLQDIKLKDGRTFEKCWPNAGYFRSLKFNDGPDIPVEDVEMVRLAEF